MRDPLGTAPSRRAFLTAAAFTPQALAQAPNGALGSPFWNQPRWVWLKRPQSGEEVREIYWADGQLVDAGYRRVCWFLRDLTQQQALYMSPILLDMLYATSGWLQVHNLARPIETTSGVRMESTNSATEGAARNSLHMQGRAHDGRIPGISLQSMFAIGAWLSGGGVGYNPGKNFCHWDDGRVRYWRG